MSWGSQTQKYDLKSTTKSFGATALGLAVKDGKLTLQDKAQKYHPSFGIPPDTNMATGWLDDITILHLANQTAGFDKPGGYVKLLFAPGSKWSYSDGGPNWLAEVMTLIYKKDLYQLMFERVFTPIGINTSELSWRNNIYRNQTIDGIPNREFGSGINASVNAMARLGYLYLRNGIWKNTEILPKSYIDQVRVNQAGGVPVFRPELYAASTSSHYGLLWWNNADGTLDIPNDAYWTWGLYNSHILVIPSSDIVVTRTGQSFPGTDGYSQLKGFFEPIAASVSNSPTLTPANTPSVTGKPGDANKDNKVDGLDYVVWLNNYNKTVSNGSSSGDFNSSGKVDGLDYVIWLSNYAK